MPMIPTTFLASARVAKTFFKKNLKSVFKDSNTGLWKAIQSKAVTGTAGDRLFPKKDSNTDKKNGVRVDLGEKVSKKVGSSTVWYRNLILQINKDPENPALKEAVGRHGTHAKRIKFEVPLNSTGDGLHPDLKKADVDAIIDELAEKGL